LKFSNDRSVWAPQYLSEGTWSSPKASLSVLVEEDILVVWLKDLADGVEVVDLRDAEVRATASFAEVEMRDDLGRVARDAAATLTVTDLAANERNISPVMCFKRFNFVATGLLSSDSLRLVSMAH